MCRFDGGNGQLLGQACHGGLENLRAWVCAFIIYHPSIVSYDPLLPSNRSTIAVVLSELMSIMCIHRDTETGTTTTTTNNNNNHSDIEGGSTSSYQRCDSATQHIIQYIYEGIIVLQKRQHDVSGCKQGTGTPGSMRSLYNHGVVISHIYHSDHYDAMYDRMSGYMSSKCSTSSVANSRTTSSASEDDSVLPLSSLSTGSSSNEADYAGHTTMKNKVGHVIPIHCGHNGWLHHDALVELKILIRDYAHFDDLQV